MAAAAAAAEERAHLMGDLDAEMAELLGPPLATGHIPGEIEDEIREQPWYRTKPTRMVDNQPWHETDDPQRMGYDYDIAMLQNPRSLRSNSANPVYNPANWWHFSSRQAASWHASFT